MVWFIALPPSLAHFLPWKCILHNKLSDSAGVGGVENKEKRKQTVSSYSSTWNDILYWNINLFLASLHPRTWGLWLLFFLHHLKYCLAQKSIQDVVNGKLESSKNTNKCSCLWNVLGYGYIHIYEFTYSSVYTCKYTHSYIHTKCAYVKHKPNYN